MKNRRTYGFETSLVEKLKEITCFFLKLADYKAGGTVATVPCFTHFVANEFPVPYFSK